MHSLSEKRKQCTHFFQYGEQSRVVFPFLKRQKLFVNGTQSYNSFEWNAKLLNNRCGCETYSNPFKFVTNDQETKQSAYMCRTRIKILTARYCRTQVKILRVRYKYLVNHKVLRYIG